MYLSVIDFIVIGGAVAVILALVLMGYFGFGSPGRRHPWLNKALIGIAGLQLAVLIYFGSVFAAEKYRHVNHLKWIAPLIFVDLLMWLCFAIGFGAAALRHRIKTGKGQ